MAAQNPFRKKEKAIILDQLTPTIMNYKIKACSHSNNNASIKIKQTEIGFGTTSQSTEKLPNPAELFLASFAACILKNVERFSGLMKFTYTKAELTVQATRLDKPPRMDQLYYNLHVYSQDSNLNTELLKKNIEKFGTIFNTVKIACTINGQIKKITQ